MSGVCTSAGALATNKNRPQGGLTGREKNYLTELVSLMTPSIGFRSCDRCCAACSSVIPMANRTTMTAKKLSAARQMTTRSVTLIRCIANKILLVSKISKGIPLLQLLRNRHRVLSLTDRIPQPQRKRPPERAVLSVVL